ncbi:hypothetical protein LINGRAHAP2_LOCUS23756 [Linum grandiflorum]
MCINFTTASSCFHKLTTLRLEGCLLNWIPSQHNDNLDLSVSFPCLVNLHISECYRPNSEGVMLQMYAPQLLNLTLLSYIGELDIEVVAPRLECFNFEFIDPSVGLDFPNFRLPYVDHAEVLVEWRCFRRRTLGQHLNMLFFGLVNAKSIVMRCRTTGEIFEKICMFLGQKLSSFTKLESLYRAMEEKCNGQLGNSASTDRHRCLPKLATLKLDSCELNLIHFDGDHFDLFVNYPRLSNFDIIDCDRRDFTGARIKIYAPQLLNLRILEKIL